MQNGRKKTVTVALGAAALLTLSACATDAEAEPTSGSDVTAPSATVETQPTTETTPTQDSSTNGEDGEDTDTGNSLPPGGAPRVPDEEIDPGTQGVPIETNFSDEGRIVGFNESARAQEPIRVYAPPPVPSPDGPTEPIAELSADDHVILGGREIVAALADGVWVEVRLADGYGWVESHLLEGFEGP